MAIRQHYYTSYNNQVTGNAGFQIKAMSPGIYPDLQATIARLIAYCIPSSLDVHAIETHPAALRYYYAGPKECILLCSQSNGTDENGRPGNFFAHTLISDQDIFTAIPAIFFWKSPFWRRKDPEERSQIVSLPLLSSLDDELSLELEEVWRFLNQNNRRQMLYKLLCAVVHSSSTQRRIVIIDKIDHVALWIAAVSCLLPPDYRPLLTFSTYHHDPYQAQYLITGTTPDSSFRTSPDDYLSFFVFNVEEGVTSSVAASAYAKLAVEYAYPDLYETRLQPFFVDYIQRFPKPVAIDEQLDQVVIYANIQQHRLESHTFSQEELDAVCTALSTFEQLQDYTERDITELRLLKDVLRKASEASDSAQVQSAYERVFALLKVHRAPTEQEILDELQASTSQLLEQGKLLPTSIFLQTLQQPVGKSSKYYDEERVIAILNSPTYLCWLASPLKKATPRQYLLLWKYIGPHLHPSSSCQDVLRAYLNEAAGLNPNDRNEFLRVMAGTMQKHAQGWLRLAVDLRTALRPDILPRFYYRFVSSFPLERRVLYRDIILPVDNQVLVYEILCDIHKAPPSQRLAVFEKWIAHARQKGYNTEMLVQKGVKELEQIYATLQEREELASLLLKNEHIAPFLTPPIEKKLILTMFSSLSLIHFSFNNLELYTKYQHHPALSNDTRIILAGIVAMTQGQMEQTLAEQLGDSIGKIIKRRDWAEYRETIEHCMVIFSQHDVSFEAHKHFLQALFTDQYDTTIPDDFWLTYQGILIERMRSLSFVKKGVRLLDFWFSLRPSDFHQRYPVQQFFLSLPAHEKFPQGCEFQKEFQDFNLEALKYPWYAVIEDSIFDKKENEGLSKKNMIQRIQKYVHLQNHNVQEQEVSEYRYLVGRLFERKSIVARHKQIPALYNRPGAEYFWSFYWQYFSDILTSGDVDRALIILNFWFDTSYEALGHFEYMPQRFFLSLPRIVKQIKDKRGFHKTIRAIIQKTISSEQEAYQWYPILYSIKNIAV